MLIYVLGFRSGNLAPHGPMLLVNKRVFFCNSDTPLSWKNTPMIAGTSAPYCKDWILTVPDSGLLLMRQLDNAQAIGVAFLWTLGQKGSNDNK